MTRGDSRGENEKNLRDARDSSCAPSAAARRSRILRCSACGAGHGHVGARAVCWRRTSRHSWAKF